MNKCLSIKGAEDTINKPHAFELATTDDSMFFIADSDKVLPCFLLGHLFCYVAWSCTLTRQCRGLSCSHHVLVCTAVRFQAHDIMEQGSHTLAAACYHNRQSN